ncbi:MAG: Txe/YoeB family addiction module toxin [Rikenellaceae bacterium]
MSYKISVDPKVFEDIDRHTKAGNKKLATKTIGLMTELRDHPRSGTGKPEQLKGYTDREMWSRRIDSKHRLIYQIKEQELIVIAISAFGHYDDK